MPRNRPEFESGTPATRPGPATVGQVLSRAGAGLAVAAAPLAFATLLLMLADAPTVGAGIDAAVTATSGPLGSAGGRGIAWLLHVAVLGVLAGCWLLGAGLVVSGLAD